MSTTWQDIEVSSIAVGDVVRLASGAEFTVARVDHPFLGRDSLACLIEDTPDRWFAHVAPINGTAQVCR